MYRAPPEIAEVRSRSMRPFSVYELASLSDIVEVQGFERVARALDCDHKTLRRALTRGAASAGIVHRVRNYLGR